MDIYSWNRGHGISRVMTPPSIAPIAGKGSDDATEAARILDAMAPNTRAVVFKANWKGEVVSDLWDIADSTPDSLLKMIEESPYDHDAHEYFDDFFETLTRVGSSIDRIILDFEPNDLKTFSIKAKAGSSGSSSQYKTNMEYLYRHSDKVKSSDELKDLNPDRITANTNSANKHQVQWNQWAKATQATTYLNLILDRARAVNPRVNLSNFGTNVVSENSPRPINVSSWDFGHDAVNNIASDMCYLDNQAHGSWIHGALKNARWNNLIRQMNNLHNAVHHPHHEAWPWVGMPSYNMHTYTSDPWLWRRMMHHMTAAGVRTFLWFNQNRGRDENEYAGRVFEEITRIDPHPAMYEPIRVDADFILTGSVLTLYEDMP